jgi:hypothetical protein
VVALTDDVTENLVRGRGGTVVGLLGRTVLEVKFVGDAGRTYAQLRFDGDRLLVLQYEPV